MKTATAALLDELMTRQGEMTDEEFSRKLGVSRPLWVMTRNGTMPPGLRVLAGVTAVYPELQNAVGAVLREIYETKQATPQQAISA